MKNLTSKFNQLIEDYQDWQDLMEAYDYKSSLLLYIVIFLIFNLSVTIKAFSDWVSNSFYVYAGNYKTWRKLINGNKFTVKYRSIRFFEYLNIQL